MSDETTGNDVVGIADEEIPLGAKLAIDVNTKRARVVRSPCADPECRTCFEYVGRPSPVSPKRASSDDQVGAQATEVPLLLRVVEFLEEFATCDRDQHDGLKDKAHGFADEVIAWAEELRSSVLAVATEDAARNANNALCFHAAKGKRCTRYLEGSRAERAQTVTWLRSLPQDEWYPANVADAIERGDAGRSTNSATTATVNRVCKARGPSGYICTLLPGHEGEHRAWGSGRDGPIESWPSAEGSTSATDDPFIENGRCVLCRKLATECRCKTVDSVPGTSDATPRCSCDDFCEGPCPAHPNPDNPYGVERPDYAPDGISYPGFGPTPEPVDFMAQRCAKCGAKNGDHIVGEGRDLRCPTDELAPLAARIAKGRAKYANGCTVLSLLDEAGEVAHAVNKYETADRVREELLDVAAVAMRLYFGEVDRGLEIDGLTQRRTDGDPGQKRGNGP